MKKLSTVSVLILAATFMFGPVGQILAATSINLGAAGNFSVLGGSTITNIGPTVVNGDMGLSPGTSVTGFPPGTVNGAQHVADTSAADAQAALTTAYNNAAGQSTMSTVPAELGGTTKTPGVYDSSDGSFAITGTLTLDAAGDPNAVFIFKAASTLTTAGASNVLLVNGAQACNVYWQVGSSATLGTNSTFKGNVLAFSSVTVTTGASIEGRVLARNGAVTLDTSPINRPSCVVAVPVPVVVVTATTTVSVTATTTSPVVATTTPVVLIAPVINSIVTPGPLVTPTFVPQFPNTGMGPGEGGMWGSVLAVISGLLLVGSFIMIFKRRQV